MVVEEGSAAPRTAGTEHSHGPSLNPVHSMGG